jgi:hypothetical protein
MDQARPQLWLVCRELMAVLIAHLTGVCAPERYIAVKASRGRASWWEPHHVVRWWWGGQNLAGDKEEWRRAGGA